MLVSATISLFILLDLSYNFYFTTSYILKHFESNQNRFMNIFQCDIERIVNPWVSWQQEPWLLHPVHGQSCACKSKDSKYLPGRAGTMSLVQMVLEGRCENVLNLSSHSVSFKVGSLGKCFTKNFVVELSRQWQSQISTNSQTLVSLHFRHLSCINWESSTNLRKKGSES